jgi:hypothetical protein
MFMVYSNKFVKLKNYCIYHYKVHFVLQVFIFITSCSKVDSTPLLYLRGRGFKPQP